MANVFLAAVLLSSILAVSGCIGGLPNVGALASALGGLPAYGGGQPYAYDPGAGGGYAQAGQPYYQQGQPYYQQSQPYYQPQPYNQPGPQATQGYPAAPPGRWIARREQRQQERIQQGQASGQLTPQEAARLQNQQRRFQNGAGGMNGNLSSREQGRFNGTQQRGNQNIYRPRHNGVQSGPTMQSQPTGYPRPTGQLHPAGQPGVAVQPQAVIQPQTAAQPRFNGGRPAHNDGGTP